MRLTEREQDRLLIFSAAELARRHISAGLKLSAPEAIALMCDAMFEAARAGATYAEVEAAGYAAVAPVRSWTASRRLVDEVRLEVMLGDGRDSWSCAIRWAAPEAHRLTARSRDPAPRTAKALR